MAYSVAVVGGSGYAGAELLRLLAGHPGIDVAVATAASHAGQPIAELYPSLGAAYPARAYATYEPGALDGLDVAFLALPHGESQRHAAALTGRVGHVVDLAADFRLPPDRYAQWYGAAHRAPELCAQFSYGLPELLRDALARHRHVAVAGCYPTAAVLALAPLLAAGLIEPGPLVVDACSGISGAGRGLSTRTHFAEADGGIVPYGLDGHRHTGEIEHALALAAGVEVPVSFVPHLVPTSRGVLATGHGRAALGTTTEAVLECLRARYAGEPFLRVVDAPSTKATFASNTCLVTARADARTGSVLAVAALDNLVKGAAGQAVQCANALLGLPETAGLTSVGVWP